VEPGLLRRGSNLTREHETLGQGLQPQSGPSGKAKHADPTNPEGRARLIGSWQSQEGKDKVDLRADGRCLFFLSGFISAGGSWRIVPHKEKATGHYVLVLNAGDMNQYSLAVRFSEDLLTMYVSTAGGEKEIPFKKE
jgi:hypothetical protein